MVQVALGIGSNLARRRHIGAGVDALRQRFGVLRLSPVYRSPSAGFDGPDFYNLVALFETSLAIDALHDALRHIESSAGRQRGDDAFVSRTLDIDILLYGDAVLHASGYDVPRGEILEYPFVLKPLADLMPAALHPQSGRSFATHWREMQWNRSADGLSKLAWSP